MSQYLNNAEIVTFLNKAQNKIAQLGVIVADEDIDVFQSTLLLDLSDFLESLDSSFNQWSELDIIRYIHFWNKRADLNNIPYILITNYKVSIVGGQGGPTGDIEAIVRSILSTYTHNSFAGIQGGIPSERYHVSKAMYDWIECQQAKSPCPDVIAPTVSLSKTSNGITWPSGFYELGTAVTLSTLQGSIALNSGKTINAYRYSRNGTQLAEVLLPGSTPVSPFSDRTSISVDTSYTFEATFAAGGTKSDTKYINFKQPMYSGVLKRSLATAANALSLTKNVRNKEYFELGFNLPVNNTLLTGGNELTPVVFIPFSFGTPSSIKVLEYEFKTDWTFTQFAMPLADGSSQPGLLGVYNKTFEGATTFKFSF